MSCLHTKPSTDDILDVLRDKRVPDCLVSKVAEKLAECEGQSFNGQTMRKAISQAIRPIVGVVHQSVIISVKAKMIERYNPKTR